MLLNLLQKSVSLLVYHQKWKQIIIIIIFEGQKPGSLLGGSGSTQWMAPFGILGIYYHLVNFSLSFESFFPALALFIPVRLKN